MLHLLPKLPYASDALEPYIDEKTMEIHHGKHHQTYVDKLNKALEKYPKLQGKSVEELIKNLELIPEDIRTAVRNHGGGHANHSFFWLILKKGVEPSGEILKAINKKFKGFDAFKEEFSTKATNIFGSGWCWLILNEKGELEIVTTGNQDSPISQGKIPVLGLDLWEHGFYLKWQSNKKGYIDNWWNVVNWQQVEKNYKMAKK